MSRKLSKSPKEITIEWSYPKLIENVLNNPKSTDENWGLYQISTKTDTDIDFLYIGKSWNDYHKRLKSHRKDWFDKYDGQKYVRFGSFISAVTQSELGEIESAIIYQTELKHNIKSTSSYTYTNFYEILSVGNRGIVPSLILTREH